MGTQFILKQWFCAIQVNWYWVYPYWLMCISPEIQIHWFGPQSRNTLKKPLECEYIFFPILRNTVTAEPLMIRGRGLGKIEENCCGQLWVRHMFCGRDLWWTVPLHIFHWSCWETLWSPNDHMDLSGPLPLRSLTNGPLFRVRFGESLVVRLYSEIDHLHLSIEVQCVIALLPLGDCNRTHCQRYLNKNQNVRGPTARPGTIQVLIPCMVIDCELRICIYFCIGDIPVLENLKS